MHVDVAIAFQDAVEDDAGVDHVVAGKNGIGVECAELSCNNLVFGHGVRTSEETQNDFDRSKSRRAFCVLRRSTARSSG